MQKESNVKFIANPDTFFFAISVDVLGVVLILCVTILSKAKILCLLLAPWLFVSVLLAMHTHVLYTINNQEFVVKHMGKTYEFLFSEIQQIDEFTLCDNLGAKRYQLQLSENSSVKQNLLTIQNDVFTKWLHKHADLFKIQKLIVL